VIPVIEKWNKLLFYPTLYEGFEFSNNVIYTGAAPNQNSVQLAEYMTTQFGARVYLVGSDYIYPYESNRIMTDLVLQHPHSATLGEAYVRLDADEHDFAPIIADIKARQPDFIFSTVVGDATARFYQMYAQAGLDPRRMPIASLTTSEAEIAQMGVAAALGHYTSAPYFQSIETPSNRQCLARYRSVRIARPIHAGRPRISRSTCMPMRIGKRAMTRWTCCCRTCWAASSTRRRGVWRSPRPITIPACTRALAGWMRTVRSRSCSRLRTQCRRTPTWSIMHWASGASGRRNWSRRGDA
jgi:hypothetical protein